MKLFTNGCSFTWGGEIRENESIPLTTNLENFRETRVWSAHLHKKLKTTELHNLSKGGASNQRIVRTTLDFFIDKLDNNIPVDDFVAVIQWTDLSRYEVWDETKKTWLVITSNSVLPEVDFVKFKKLMQRFEDDDKTYYSNWYHQLICLSSFFELHKIKYVFCTMDYIFINESKNDIQYILPDNYLKHNIKWLGTDSQSNQILNSIDYFYPKCHPNLKGHEIIAERLYNRLKELYNI
jgi:hypothetical protein